LFDDFFGEVSDRFFDYLDNESRQPEKKPEGSVSEEKREGETKSEGGSSQEGGKQGEESEKSEVQGRAQERRPALRRFFSHSRTYCDGGDVVEERREKVTNSNGESRECTLRRIGDKWYENEVLSDKDGKKTQKESWHNVSENEFEEFQNRWKKSALTQSKSEENQKESSSQSEKPAAPAPSLKEDKPADK
jgi:hypothetical protein